MEVQIGDNAIKIGKDRVRCTAHDNLLIKSLVTQWAKEILALNNDGNSTGIPVEIEGTEIGTTVLYLVAVRHGSSTILRFICIYDDYFEWSTAMVFTPKDYLPYSFVETFQDIVSKGDYAYPQPFGEYSTQILVDALLKAEIV